MSFTKEGGQILEAELTLFSFVYGQHRCPFQSCFHWKDSQLDRYNNLSYLHIR